MTLPRLTVTTPPPLDHVRYLAGESKRVRVELLQAMNQAKQEGATLQQIGDAAGISRQRVSQILNGKAKR